MDVGVGVGGVWLGRRVAVGGAGVGVGVFVGVGGMVAAAPITKGLAVGKGANKRTCS
jgi:hypothetical protein